MPKMSKSSRTFQRSVRNGPAQLRTNIEVKHQYRFTSSSSTPTQITDALLLTAAGVSASSATVGRPIFETVKVNRIEMWTPPSTQGAAVTCSVLFPAAYNSQAREYTDTSVSVSTPAHVACRPPPNSLCSFWQNGAGNPLFTLVAPIGTIIDLWLSLVVSDGVTASSTATLVGATIGVVYYCSLDSSTSAGSKYPPVALTSL